MMRLLAATAISALLPLRGGAAGPFDSFTLEEIMADPAKEAELSAAVGEALKVSGATLDVGRRELQASADWDAGLRELLPAPPSTCDDERAQNLGAAGACEYDSAALTAAYFPGAAATRRAASSTTPRRRSGRRP